MVPLNMTYLDCLQHSLFEHLFNLYLFTIRPIASKQSYGLTTIGIFSLFGGAVVTHPFLGARGPVFNSRLWQGFYVCVVFLLFISQNTLFVTKCLHL